MKRILFLAIVFSAAALAQDVPAAPTYLDSILAWLATGVGMVASAVGIIEVILRMFPSVKPLSFLIPAKYLVDGIAFILKFSSDNVLTPMISHLQVTKAPLK